MPEVVWQPDALDDLDRLDLAVPGAVGLIHQAVMFLADHPEIGRRIAGGLRELVISRGKTGYIALYRYSEVRDQVVLLAIRHQREAGFDPG